MKRQEVEQTIPIALQELHEAGLDKVYVDQLGQQVTRHETKYLEKRDAVRRVLGYVGIKLNELPHGHSRPGAYKMYYALEQLEEAGVIAAELEEPIDGAPSRRKYFLVNHPE